MLNLRHLLFPDFFGWIGRKILLEPNPSWGRGGKRRRPSFSPIEEAFMKFRNFAVVIAILTSFLLVPETAVRAESESLGLVRIMTGDPEGAAYEAHPLGENEVQYLAVQNGVVVGTSTIQTKEMDVIIQLKEDPLIRLKGQKRGGMAAAAADRRRVLNFFKGEVTQLDEKFRRAKGLSARSTREVIKREFTHLLNGLAARVTREAVKEIEKLPRVKRVWRDEKVQVCLNQSVPLIGGDRVWSDLNTTGRGMIVAIVDTGIDYTHPDLGGCLGVGCKVIGGYDFVHGHPYPMDDHGHGTHVAGIVAANGYLKGVAPDAKLMAFKVLDQWGSGAMSDVIAAIERATDPDGNPETDDGAHIINLSLGGTGDPDDPVSQAVDNAVAAGVVVVVAAGNSGSGYETIGSPGAARQALTVGAADKSDGLAWFSSRGPAPITYQIKPEVVAPGVGITSTVPAGICSLCDPSGYRSLSGTSMATPHVAGTAALLLERFPTWTPKEVREALMERSLNLGSDVFTQGSGRIDAYASAATPTLGEPGNLSLGLDDLSQPTFWVQKTIQLTNLTSAPQSYQFMAEGNYPPGLTIQFAPSSLNLGPGETASFNFHLNADNLVLPDASKIPYAYEGAILAVGDGHTLRLPFAFIKSPILEVTLDEEPWLLTVHNQVDFGKDIFYPGLSRAILVPKGSYDVIALFKDATTRVVRENLEVTTKTRVNIAEREAAYPLTIIPIDQDGNPLTLTRGMGMSVFRHKASGFGGIISSWFPSTRFNFSTLSNAYLFETTLFENRNSIGGLAYTFHGYAREGITGPITFQNSPLDLKQVVTGHHPDPGASRIFSWQWLSSRPGPYFSIEMARCDFSDPPLTTPFEEKAYYLPHPYPEFQLGYITKDVYRQPTSPCNFQEAEWLYKTPYLTAREEKQLDAFLWGEVETPVFSTTSETLPSGVGPAFWSGQFKNHPVEVQLWPVWGTWLWLYTRQMGEVSPQNPLPYELYQDGRLIQSGTVRTAYLGGSPFWASISLPSSGPYTLKIPYSNYFVAGQQGSALMEASFDTGKPDPNPPHLLQFKVTKNGEATDILVAESGQVSFTVADDVSLKRVNLFYDAGNGWEELALNNLAPGEYLADLPSLAKSSFVSLKLSAEDASGNLLTYTMSPAVFSKVETLTAPTKPSGPETGSLNTIYSYTTGGSRSDFGHELQYLFDWGDGTNSGWLAAGITSTSKTWAYSGIYLVKSQARCKSHTSFVSPWSESLSVTIGTPEKTLPGPATLLSPDGTLTDTTPTYRWNAVPYSTRYYLWVDDSKGTRIKQWYNASEAGCASGVGTCSVTPAAQLAAGAGKWWIQTWSPAGYGPWSQGKSFTVSSEGGSFTVTPPGASILVSPSGSIMTPTPTYTWNAVPESSWYYLWVNDSTGIKIQQWYRASEAGCSSGTGICSVTPATELAGGAAKWWVQTWNPVGYGPWSQGMAFTVSPPPAATLVSPSGMINVPTPTYTWNAVPDSTWYYLWVDDSTGNKIQQWYKASEAGCASGAGTCSVQPSTALVNGAGRWWVQTWSTAGYGPWSQGMSFTVMLPGTATLISPSGTITDPTPTYTWNAVPGSDWYYLWGNDSAGIKIQQWYKASEANCDPGTGICDVTPSMELDAGPGEWWIQAWSPAGYGPWSSPMLFTVSP